MKQGLLSSVLYVIALGLCFWPILSTLASQPSAQLLRYMGALGATMLVAYAIESSAAVRSTRFRDPTQERWIGALVGSASAGLLGIITALSLGERAAVGHWSWADDLAFAFAFGSLALLGIFVVLLPFLTYEWSRLSNLDGDD